VSLIPTQGGDLLAFVLVIPPWLGVISSAFGGDLLAFVLVIPPGFPFCCLMLPDSLSDEGNSFVSLLGCVFLGFRIGCWQGYYPCCFVVWVLLAPPFSLLGFIPAVLLVGRWLLTGLLSLLFLW
jgi:hypothetical protein